MDTNSNDIQNVYNVVRDVAVYLRLSRDETKGKVDVLANHEAELTAFAKRNNWRITIYKEIGSSETIADRPEMTRLLADIDQDYYDACLVMDFDRLTRGDEVETGQIKRIFKQSETLIVTPTKVYDLNTEQGILMSDFESLIARMEYRTIKKRLARGKRLAAKRGLWSNGTPPLGYVYNRNTKTLDTDQAKVPLYNRIKSMFLDDGMSCKNIAMALNKDGIPSPKRKSWTQSTIYRLLLSETHAGRIVFGRRKHNAKGILVNVPRENWIIVQGNHEVLKTEDEHRRIVETLEAKQMIPVGARAGKYALSGLVKCIKCGRYHQMTRNGKQTVYVRKCSKANADGSECSNVGIKESIVMFAMEAEFIRHEKRLMKAVKSGKSDSTKEDSIRRDIEFNQAEIKKVKSRIERIKELFYDGEIGRGEYKEDKAKEETKLYALNDAIAKLQSEFESCVMETVEERLERTRKAKQTFDKSTDSTERNDLLHSMLKEIVYCGDSKALEFVWK